jgi:prepilin signal peptidase PulO-like enzyme (type II secretory pathway)
LADVGIATELGTVADRGPLLPYPGKVAPLAIAAAVLAFAVFPLDASAFIAAFLAAVLVVLSATDIERGIIPNRIVLPATAVVLIARIAFFPGRALEWILAAVLAALALFLPRLLNASAFGMGDVKLALLLGAGLGWGVALALPLAFVLVFPAALLVVVRGGLAARNNTLPFGPFMAFGALIILIVPHLAGFATA